MNSPTAISVLVALATRFFQASPGDVLPVTPPAAPFAGDNIFSRSCLGQPQTQSRRVPQ